MVGRQERAVASVPGVPPRGAPRRGHGTDRNGRAFAEEIRAAVWARARIVPGVNPKLRRKDACGAWIEWARYGETAENGGGWEIDHVIPVARGGGDDLANLQPLQWENNRFKGDRHPRWACLIRAAD